MYDTLIGLYLKSEYNVDSLCIAIVITRHTTLYGHSVALRFVSELSQLDFCIISGMARGTDTEAH